MGIAADSAGRLPTKALAKLPALECELVVIVGDPDLPDSSSVERKMDSTLSSGQRVRNDHGCIVADTVG
jgi:hypothetical protein